MKVTWAFAAALGVALMTAGGCVRPQGKQVNPLVVSTEDGSAFPASLAGQWRADQHGWEFVIEPDGRIASAIISFGRVRVSPGQTATVPTKTGDQAVFTPGPWMVHYDPTTLMLTVKITMAHIRLPLAANVLEGTSTDIFSGAVSPAMDTWQVQWTSFTDYTARLDDGTSRNLSTDKTYGETLSLVFTKTGAR